MHRANSVRHAECSSSSNQPQAATNSSLHQFADKVRSQTQPSNNEDNNNGRTGVAADRSAANKSLATRFIESDKNLNSQQRHLQAANTEQQVYLKSCLSDGDFNEILIKVNDHPDHESEQQQACQKSPGFAPPFQEPNETFGGLECELDKARRRSSCSDAEDQRANL